MSKTGFTDEDRVICVRSLSEDTLNSLDIGFDQTANEYYFKETNETIESATYLQDMGIAMAVLLGIARNEFAVAINLDKSEWEIGLLKDVGEEAIGVGNTDIFVTVTAALIEHTG